MNWLTPLCQDIVKDKRFSREQRDTAVLWANELSALCDRWASRAPMPILEKEPEDGAVAIYWIWKKKQRSLALYIESDLSVWMQMLDDGRARTETRVDHEMLKRSVQCFFEGWEPTHAPA